MKPNYGFREKPFSLVPDPDFLYLGRNHRTALNILEYGLRGEASFALISGEVGSGKTILIRRLSAHGGSAHDDRADHQYPCVAREPSRLDPAGLQSGLSRQGEGRALRDPDEFPGGTTRAQAPHDPDHRRSPEHGIRGVGGAAHALQHQRRQGPHVPDRAGRTARDPRQDQQARAAAARPADFSALPPVATYAGRDPRLHLPPLGGGRRQAGHLRQPGLRRGLSLHRGTASADQHTLRFGAGLRLWRRAEDHRPGNHSRRRGGRSAQRIEGPARAR